MISATVDLVKNIKTVMAQFSSEKTATQVAVAVICNNDNESKILITQRGYTSYHPGKWEFPGGKILTNETPVEALSREIKEELGIQILNCHPLTQVSYSYNKHKFNKFDTEYETQVFSDNKECNVNLIVYKVTAYTGKEKCLENQLRLEWVYAPDLSKYDFLEANYIILDLIQSEF